MLPKIHIEVEKWKFNKNYNLYVSNMGNFKDKSKEDIKLMVEKGGYLQVPVCNNKQGKIKYLQAHRVVMETWCPKQNMWKDKLTVDHLDNNKRNNKDKNLEWVTQQENLKRAAAGAWDKRKRTVRSGCRAFLHQPGLPALLAAKWRRFPSPRARPANSRQYPSWGRP